MKLMKTSWQVFNQKKSRRVHQSSSSSLFKGEVRTINDRNICERRSCMKNNGKSPTFKFVSGEEKRLSEVQRVSRGWCLPGATHSSADLTWIRKSLEIQASELSEPESVELELGSYCSYLDKQVSDEICRGLGRDNLRSHFVFRPRHAPEWLRARFLPVVLLANEEELTGKTFTTSLNTTNPNTYVKFIFLRTSPLRQDPLDLSFWSFLTFLHHGIEEVKRHLLWKFYKRIRRKSWSNVPPKLVACIGFLYKVVHKIGRLRKFNRSRGI